MQKLKKYWIVVFIIMLCLTGCTISNTGTSNIDGGTEPTNQFFCKFDSYDEIKEWFTLNEEEMAPAMAEIEQHGDAYEEFVSNMISGNIQIVKAYMGNELMEFRNKDVFWNIDIYCQDGERPWIWYFCLVNNMECQIRIMYLEDDEVEYAKNHTMDQVVKYIYPSASYVDNWHKSSYIKNLYLESLRLNDRTVSAMCEEHYDDPRLYKSFIYDNMYIIVVGVPEVLDEDIWKTFSLRAE